MQPKDLSVGNYKYVSGEFFVESEATAQGKIQVYLADPKQDVDQAKRNLKCVSAWWVESVYVGNLPKLFQKNEKGELLTDVKINFLFNVDKTQVSTQVFDSKLSQTIDLLSFGNQNIWYAGGMQMYRFNFYKIDDTTYELITTNITKSSNRTVTNMALGIYKLSSP